jgi:Ser/Thr protein kinase RdoA (MazF antagonist)
VSGEYTPDVVADLERMVAAGLARWGLPSATPIRLLNLSENATFVLAGVGGAPDRILRVHRVGYSSADEIRSELEWIMALRGAGVIDTALPIAGRDGELVQRLVSQAGRAARHAVMFERLAGAEPDPKSDARVWFERLGEVTARMHAHSRAWTLPPGFCRKRWDLDGMIGPRAYWGRWQAAHGLDAPGARVLEDALALVRERLERFGVDPARFGLVHADLRLANLLVDGEYLRIIDFDDCGFSWFLYDFATSVSFIEHDPVVPELLEAWLAGYRRCAPLLQTEVAEIPTFVALRRILLSAWLASHAELPLARELGAGFTAGTVAIAQALLEGRYLRRQAPVNAAFPRKRRSESF